MQFYKIRKILRILSHFPHIHADSVICYWRSRETEVDLIIGTQLAIEIKFSKTFKPEFMNGLKALKEEGLVRNYAVIGRFSQQGQIDGVRYMDYETFLRLLWSDRLEL